MSPHYSNLHIEQQVTRYWLRRAYFMESTTLFQLATITDLFARNLAKTIE